MTPPLERWPTKAKEAPFPHEVRLALLYTNPVFQSLGKTYAKDLSYRKDLSWPHLEMSQIMSLLYSRFLKKSLQFADFLPLTI